MYTLLKYIHTMNAHLFECVYMIVCLVDFVADIRSGKMVLNFLNYILNIVWFDFVNAFYSDVYLLENDPHSKLSVSWNRQTVLGQLRI